MLFKRAISSIIVGMLITGLVQPAFATSATQEQDDTFGEIIIDTEISGEVVDGATISEEIPEVQGIEDLGVQLNDLYHEVGKSLNIDYIYVKIIHLLAGGKAVYADKRPNIRSEITVDTVKAPFEIDGANQNWDLSAPWIICPDEEIERPSKYYIPDAAYSATSEVVKLMNTRYYADRGQMESYFNALSNDVKTNIIFCEAIMEYIGSDRDAIESFYPVYEKVLYEKEKNENVIEANGDGTFTMKDKFKTIFMLNNIDDPRDLEVLSLILSFDSKLAVNSSPDALKESYVLPYKLGYTSRENMMLAAMSVVGKVRYVWGGGHVSTGTIDGINPSWEAFFNTYGENEDEPGYGRCIKPTISWCPIHGTVEAENGCLLGAETVYSVEQYVDSRKEIMNTETMEGDKYKDLLESSINFGIGVNSHRLDGLDCSGYASWLFNQVVSKRNYDAGALNFISAGGLKVVDWGSRVLPGDVFSWGDHIVVAIGPSTPNSKAYVMVESSPNMVKFGVMYYSGAKQSDVNMAIQQAREANDLIGGLPVTEKTHIYNMDACKFSSEELGEAYADRDGYHQIGRLNYSFLDENMIIPDYNKKIKEMTAQEIIQYTMDNMADQYISGLSTYTGTLYNTSKFEKVSIDDTMAAMNEAAAELTKDIKDTGNIGVSSKDNEKSAEVFVINK